MANKYSPYSFNWCCDTFGHSSWQSTTWKDSEFPASESLLLNKTETYCQKYTRHLGLEQLRGTIVENFRYWK
jgi:hypothetical protein